jgi:hypothetical protein
MTTTEINIYTIPKFTSYEEFDAYLNKIQAGEISADKAATLTEYDEEEVNS